MPNREFLNIVPVTANKARIEIDGTIGGFDWDEWKYKNTGTDIRAKLKELDKLPVSEIEVLITSLGGYVDDALQIHDALKEHPAKVTTIVQGFCASAATVIACAGDRRIISPNALFLIHKCMNSVYDANENVLEEQLESQRKTNEVILGIYKGVLKKDESELNALFAANNGKGKWITAEEALAFGFATEIQEFDTDEKKPATAMARFLNHARALFPEMNTNPIINQNPAVMKKFYLSFAMLGALLAFKDDTEYDEKTGVLLNPDQLQKMEDKLKAFADLEAKFSQKESDLQKANEDLAAANTSIAEKDTLIATLTAERDNYKAKYEKAPANVPGVNGKDVNVNEESVEDYVKNSSVYQKTFEENL
ncbi:MAG: Clp protease ClpP [Bacteroidales bacterium]|nr:Clp protease ClpP [Bacteroidales bacterium]